MKPRGPIPVHDTAKYQGMIPTYSARQVIEDRIECKGIPEDWNLKPASMDHMQERPRASHIAVKVIDIVWSATAKCVEVKL